MLGMALARPLTELSDARVHRTRSSSWPPRSCGSRSRPSPCRSSSAFCTGVLNSHRRFFLSYASPVMWNLGQISFLVAAGIYGATDVGLAHALTLGLLAGAFSEVLIQVRSVRRLMGRARLHLGTTSPDTRSVVSRFVPVIAGRGVIQLVGYLELVLASLLAVGGVSALTYSQLLYLLPISLFGMAVAAAELPELARLGERGLQAISERLAFGLDRIAFYVLFTAAMYLFVGDVVVGALLQRGDFTPADTRLVWLTVGAFSLGPPRHHAVPPAAERALRPRPLPHGRAGWRCCERRWPTGLGALFMFPLDRWKVVGSEVVRDGDLGLGPLPDSLRLVDHGTPRLGIVGLALGAAISSWVEYRLLRRALRPHIGLPPTLLGPRPLVRHRRVRGRHPGRGAPHRHPRPHPLLAAPLVLVPAAAVYLSVTASAVVPESRALVDSGRAGLPPPARLVTARDVGVGPHPRPWPDDPRLDPELLEHGDRRNVVDRYRYWTRRRDRRRPRRAALPVPRGRRELGVRPEHRHRRPQRQRVRGRQRADRRPAPLEPTGGDGHRPVPARGPPPDDRRARSPGPRPRTSRSSGSTTCRAPSRSRPPTSPSAASSVRPGGTRPLPAAHAGCDTVCSIVQVGSTRSINAGVASGIAMHTWLRQHALSSAASLGQDDEVVAVDDLVGHALGEVGGAAAGHLAQAGRAEADEALGEHLAVEAGDLHRVVDLEAALDLADPRGEQRHAPLEQRPAGPVVDHDRAVGADRERDPELAGGQPPRASGARRCRRPARRPPTASSTPSRDAWAITARTPDHAAILAAASFDAMPAAAPDGARLRRPSTRASGRPPRSPRSARPTSRAGGRR